MNGAGSLKNSNFLWGALLLPREKRRALASVYDFCRLMDDIVDSGNLEPHEARRMLGFWKEEVRRLYEGNPTHSRSRELLPHVREYRLPREAFLGLIDGVEMDLLKSRYRTFPELEPYLHGVAVTVGRLCVEIFGHRHTSARDMDEYCRNMGYAFQLTNILRDVGADLEKGRVYLPLEELAAAGYGVEALLRREHNPAFTGLMARQYERTKGFYARARNLLHPLDRPSMVAAEVMARVYEGLLDRVRELGYRVLFQRVSLSPWAKARLSLAGYAFSYGLW